MTNATSSIVYVLEDDPTMGKWYSGLLQSIGVNVAVYPTGHEFLNMVHPSDSACAVMDMILPDMTGLAVLEKMQERGIWLPVIFASGYGDVGTAVQAMKAGAEDFLEKPLKAQVFLDAVQKALAKSHHSHQIKPATQEVQGLMARLTPREREVLELIMAGLSNKEMAKKIGVSPRTIEVHRANLYSKMRADSLADLVRKGLAISHNA
ncbi:MAG: response regulator transcription factor [Hydrogenophilaceae bacterium]|nr:response regulator transcription factor [Hydrogenophilaceae bacterium]